MTSPVSRPTLFDALSASAPFAPTPVLTPDALRALEPAARSVPAAGAGCFYFESKLRDGAPDVDLVFELNRTGMRAVCGEGGASSVPPRLAETSAWTNVARYARAALAAPSVEYGGRDWPSLGPLWLEFDAARGAVPGIFSGLLETLYGDPLAFARDERPAWYLGGIGRALGALGVEAPRAAYDQAAALVEALPEGPVLSVFGLMMQRPRPALRLCFERMEMADVVPYLGAIGWGGDVAQVRDVIGRLTEGPGVGPLPRTFLHVDVWDGVMPRVGVEFCFRRPAQFHGRFEEAPWLDRLVDLGLASAEKCAALSAWPGVSVFRHARRQWRPDVVNRRVNHVKVVFEHGRVEAKAYLCCTVGARAVAPVEC